MHHFFVHPNQIQERRITIEGMDVNHMKNVLRMKLGEEVLISDGTSKDYICTVAEIEKNQIYLDIIQSVEGDRELSSRIYLFQGLPKGDKMELIIQKAVELGVYEVIPVAMKRCVVKLDKKKETSKGKRWKDIAKEAAKQSKRNLIPEVHGVLTYKEALEYGKDLDIKLIPYELATGMVRTKEVISNIKPGQNIGIFIGPEGGFEEEEIALGEENGFSPITLGKRILRTETAGLAILAILMYHLED
ncbi:MAG TPA: 16S rRNA (uracil(1498)-N(3))-methyltransferase [Candidatus Merdenecus merdavium]|nr:16S rRNA (uracil(1498)-N(3))-methyltransferase [Candidatus Merdenecus merdavium]